MKNFPATALIPFLWLMPGTEARSSDDAPAREKAASPEKREAVPWRRCTVYASPGSKVKEEASLFRIRVLRSPEGTACVLHGDRPFEVLPKDGTLLVFQEMKKLPLPGNVREILDLKRRDDSGNMRRPFSEYKKTTGYFDYSCTVPREYHTFFFGDGGDVFLLEKSQGASAPSLKINHHFRKLHIRKCGLDARKGKIPVFYYRGISGEDSTLVSDFLGLVSLADGTLTELGPYEDMGLSSIKWLNDHELFICMKTRKSSAWAVYDIRRKREAARGSTALDSSDESSERFLGDYIVRKGVVYGLQWDGRVKRLYPAP